MTKDCNCGKPKPGPLGGQPPRSMVASAGRGSVTHVAPNGARTSGLDLLAARAAVARRGGSVDLG